MTTGRHGLIGGGIYTISEAYKLTHVSQGRIRRWVKGYSFPVRGDVHTSPPIVKGLPPIDGTVALAFLDLIEIRFVDGFLNKGVSWKALRRAYGRAQSLLGTNHPFSTRKLSTDGRTIFMEVAQEVDEPPLLDLVKNQLAFKAVVTPYLKDLDFDQNDGALRWWPLGRNRPVVIDPLRTFGQPIVSVEGVPTAILSKAYSVEGSFDKVARWFQVARRSVRAAVEFEDKLAA